MTVSQATRAAAALELRRRQADGSNRVGVLVRGYDCNGWRWKGDIISDDEAAQVRRSFRGQLVIVNRAPAVLPASTAEAPKHASA